VIVIGVDPGARWTGIVARDGNTLLGHLILRNGGELFPVELQWLRLVTDAVENFIRVYNADLLAVEGVTRPNWHVGKGRAAANPSAILATAEVAGAVQGCVLPGFTPVVSVRPGKHDKAPMCFYPEALVSDAERRKPDWRTRVGGGQLRHARAAWSIAQAGLLARQAELA